MLEGRTDPRGTDKSNLDLSRFRAVYLRNFLVKELNVHPSRFIVNYYGEIDPISIKDQDNRSVTISYIKDEPKPKPIIAQQDIIQNKEPRKITKKIKRIPSKFAPVIVALSAYEADLDGQFSNDPNRRVDEVLSDIGFELSISSAYNLNKKTSIPFEVGVRLNEFSENSLLRINRLRRLSPFARAGVRHQTTRWLSNTFFVGWDNLLIHILGSTDEVIPTTEQILHADYEPTFTFFKTSNWGIYLKPLISYLIGLEDIDNGTRLGLSTGFYYKKIDFFIRYRQANLEHNNDERELTTEDLTFGLKYKL